MQYTKPFIQTEKTLKEGFEEFIRIKELYGISEKSISNYKYAFTQFVQTINGNEYCYNVSSETINLFIKNIKTNNPNILNTSVNSYLRSLRAFVYFLIEKEYTYPFKISMLKEEGKIKETYTNSELEKLLQKPKSTAPFHEYRNYVIICYLLGTGNRLSTLINLKLDDINFEDSEIKLRILKNKRPYSIPISNYLKEVLSEYILIRKNLSGTYLFCNQYGKQLTCDGLKKIIYKYNKSRSVEKTSIHLFRHTFAKKWILNKGDAFRLKVILGHNSMTMVNRYVNMFGNDLHKDFNLFNPLDNLDFIAEEKPKTYTDNHYMLLFKNFLSLVKEHEN